MSTWAIWIMGCFAITLNALLFFLFRYFLSSGPCGRLGGHGAELAAI